MKTPSGLKKADTVAVNITKYFSYLGGVAVGVAMLISVIDIILIKIFNSSFPSAHEWVTYLNIMMVFPALAYVELDRGHIAVNFMDNIFPDGLRKGIRIFSRLLAVALMGFITYRGAVLTMDKFASGESSSANAFAVLSFKTWTFAALYTVSCGLFTLSFVWTLVREFTGMSILDTKQEDESENEPGKEPEIEEGGESV